MVNYKNGKIYKVASKNSLYFYVGATTLSLRRRFYNHKNLVYNKCSSIELTKLGGLYIELLENYPCNSLEELSKREQEYIDKFRKEKQPIINKTNSYISKEDRKKYLRKYFRDYYHTSDYQKFNDLFRSKKRKKLVCDWLDYLKTL